MVPQIKAGEVKFLVGWGRIRPGRRRRRSRRLSNPDFWIKALRVAAACRFQARLRHCLVFVNKICQSRDADLHMVFRLFCFYKSLTKTALFEPFCLFFAILGSCLDSREAEKSPLAKAMAVRPVYMKSVEFNNPPPHTFFWKFHI